MQITTQALVIGTRDIDEEDRLLTLLSKEHGVLYAYARGVRRMRSRLAPTTGLLCCSNFVLFQNKERYTVDHADSVAMFFGLRQDIVKLSLATYFAELSAVIVPRGEPAPDYLRLLLNTLHLLEKGKRTPDFLKPVFELRAMTLSGFMPNLVACRECACYEAPRMFFLIDNGELLCESCLAKAEGVSVQPQPLTMGMLASMRHIIYSELEKLFSFELPPAALAALGDITERYLIRQTEHSYQTLDFYKAVHEQIL